MMTRILVIDDEMNFSSLLCLVMKGAGYEVRSAASVTDGLMAAKSWTPDVLITDYLLESGHGLELARELHKHKPELVVIVLSGVPVEDVRLAASGIPTNAILQKPVDLDQLLTTVRRLAAGPHPSAAPKPMIWPFSQRTDE